MSLFDATDSITTLLCQSDNAWPTFPWPFFISNSPQKLGLFVLLHSICLFGFLIDSCMAEGITIFSGRKSFSTTGTAAKVREKS